MGNVITYTREQLHTFEEEPFSTIDSMIFSWLSYMRWPEEIKSVHTWDGVRLADLYKAEYYDEMLEQIAFKEDTIALFSAMCASPRYRDIIVKGYLDHIDTESEKQFSAVTFQLNDDLCYIAFRGTDSTFVGWKEDFNLAFRYPIPSQEEAATYVSLAAQRCTGHILLGGHSKGGNLAMYAGAMNGFIAERIDKIYSHDGPGFMEEVLEKEQFKAIRPKVEKTVPESSIVGMILENHSDYTVVKSSQRSLWQHNLLTWEIEDGQLVLVPELSKSALRLDENINAWVRSVSKEEREAFVDALYTLVDNVEVDKIQDLGNDWQTNFAAMRESAENMDPETKELVGKVFAALAEHTLGFSIKTDSTKPSLLPTVSLKPVSEWTIFRRKEKDAAAEDDTAVQNDTAEEDNTEGEKNDGSDPADEYTPDADSELKKWEI